MRSRLCIALLVMPVTLAFVFGPCWISAQDKTPSRAKWEYKIVQSFAKEIGTSTGPAVVPGTISEKELNALGDQGWELFKVSDGQPILKGSNFSATVYYFKRPK
jgi:hypothetical protein